MSESNRVSRGMLAIEMSELDSVSISSAWGAMGKGKRGRGIGESFPPSKVQKVSSTAWSDPRSGSSGSGTPKIRPTIVYIRDFVKDLGTLNNQRKALSNEHKELKEEWSAMATELLKNLKDISHGVHGVQKAANRLGEKIARELLDPGVVHEQMLASLKQFTNQDSVAEVPRVKETEVRSESQETTVKVIEQMDGNAQKAPETTPENEVANQKVNRNILRSGPIKEEVDASDIAKASGTIKVAASLALTNQGIKNEPEPVKEVKEAQPDAQMGGDINALTPSAARSIPTRPYLDRTVVPILFQALADRPENPVDYLVKNGYMHPGLLVERQNKRE